MPLTPSFHIERSTSSFAESFFAPAVELLTKARYQRHCPELSDVDWLRLGVRRALEDHASGRAFLQHLVAAGLDAPYRSHFFATLKSTRRLALIAEVSHGLAKRMPALDKEFWNSVPEINGFDLYAGDGHFHAAAAHDPRDPEKGIKYGVGHFFSLDLRSHALAHLTVADQIARKKEHDMRALKRLHLTHLRQGAKKGRKVLYVWDRAGIDFLQWHQWKHTGALYFLSREKEKMNLKPIKENEWDRADLRNQGVISDELVTTSQGVNVRRVRYYCALRDEEFSFLTSEFTLPPGVIAHLYRLRWEIEKTFDELKNKLGETKAWASSANAKAMQANFVCLAHNLMILCESDIERVHGVRNEAELERRANRLDKEEQRLRRDNQVMPVLVRTLQRLTQRSVKFVRWLRVQLFTQPHHEPNIDALRQLYAAL